LNRKKWDELQNCCSEESIIILVFVAGIFDKSGLHAGNIEFNTQNEE
jgi:hypothetical protein